jgi:hypothetical protein
MNRIPRKKHVAVFVWVSLGLFCFLLLSRCEKGGGGMLLTSYDEESCKGVGFGRHGYDFLGGYISWIWRGENGLRWEALVMGQ